MTLMPVKEIIRQCQEQIDLSGFVTHELSAFLFQHKGIILEQEESGGRALPQTMRSYPQPISRSLCGARREGAVGNSVKPLFSSL
jgi:hypothetical protein